MRRATSASEIVKRARSIGAASGWFLSRRRSQARELKPVEPQRRLQERLEKPLALRWVEPRPASIVASNRSTRRISRAFEKRSAKETTKTKIANMLKGRRRAVPAGTHFLSRTRTTDHRGGGSFGQASRVSRHHRDTVRAINDGASAFEAKAGYPRTHKPFPISFAASTN